MNSKEVISNLLQRKKSPRMGVFDAFWGEALRDWVKDGYPEGIAADMHFNHDLLWCGTWFDTTSFPNTSELVEQSDEWEVKKDGRGATLKYWKKKSGTPEHIAFECTTEEIWRKKYREPLLTVSRSRINFELARAYLALSREMGKFSIMGNLYIFELMRGTMGDENFLPALLLEPDWIKDFCNVYLDFYIKHFELLFREVGLPDGIWMFEDLGYKNGPFCSPATMKELIQPYYTKLNNFFHDYKLPVILHSCGDIRKAMPMIIESGYACIQPMEAKAGCNVIEMAKEYKDKIAFMGNIDVTVLNTNDKTKIREEIEGKMKALKKMGASYIYHSDHSIPPSISYDTYKFCMEVYKENCNY